MPPISYFNAMRYLKVVFLLLLPMTLFFSCDSKLQVNAAWKDITVVYGLLNQNDTVHYLKITKAFLGEGNALMFATIPDSSNYPDKLDVKLEGWEKTSQYDSTLKQTILFDTITITNKEKGTDSAIFYYPLQLVYKSAGFVHLNQNYLYKLSIKRKSTGKEITAQTPLVNKITSIEQPHAYPAKASFIPGMVNQLVFTTVKGGKRYQVVGRFYYLETSSTDTTSKYVDWVIFSDIKTDNTKGGETLSLTYPCDAFYTVIGNGIHADIANNNLPGGLKRVAYKMEYIFTVAGDDLNTYMEVTEPSYTIVQERPPYTNIVNGIGLFSARYNQSVIQRSFGDQTIAELKVNPATSDLGF